MYMQKKKLCFLLCLCNLNYLVVSCNLVPLQLLNKLHFVLNYCGEMAGHETIHLGRRQLFNIFDPYPPLPADFITVRWQIWPIFDPFPPLQIADVLNGWPDMIA